MNDPHLQPIPSHSAIWHALRLRHIGASEVATLFDSAPAYAPGPFALWNIKAGRVPAPEVDNQRAKWGLLLEDAIAAAAAEREDWTVLPGVYASRGGLGATLDRIIAEPGGPYDSAVNGPGVLELKNADWLVYRRGWEGEPPIHVLLQLQAQLLATGYSWGAVAVLVGGNQLEVFRYTARPKLQAEIAARVAYFWQSIAEGKPPEPDGSSATYQALMHLEPEIANEPVDLSQDNEAPILCAAYLTASAEEKAAAAKRAEARNRLLAKLGGGSWAEVPGFRLSQSEVQATVDRLAAPNEIIRGRAASRRITVREHSF